MKAVETSIIIPVFNEFLSIKKQAQYLLSLLSETTEVIVVDNLNFYLQVLMIMNQNKAKNDNYFPSIALSLKNIVDNLELFHQKIKKLYQQIKKEHLANPDLDYMRYDLRDPIHLQFFHYFEPIDFCEYKLLVNLQKPTYFTNDEKWNNNIPFRSFLTAIVTHHFFDWSPYLTPKIMRSFKINSKSCFANIKMW